MQKIYLIGKNGSIKDGKEKKIVFSGDIGNLNQPLIKDPVYLHDADYVIMESTYGDRSHGERPDYIAMLTEVIQHTFDRGGSVVIPSFAVGRTQEMLYFIRQIKEEGRVHGHDNFKVYVDSRWQMKRQRSLMNIFMTALMKKLWHWSKRESTR